jgi:GTP-binding protein HflX
VQLAESLRLARPNPSTLLGKGVVERLKEQFAEKDVAVVIINHPLTPVQQRNLEREWQRKVIDRTGLILEIFGERAQTREGQLQVELAALDFQRSRLVRSWTHLERQRGGFGFLGGPGESQLEIDRRLIEDRMIRIRKDLDKVRQTRALQREARHRSETPLVALVGYTNAGKSTLFNALTGAGVLAENMLFATLDPTLRRVSLPSGRECVLSDTVGFISSLPHQLVAAFRATLEEVEQADLILHVRDVSSPETLEQKKDVEMTLSEMGIDTEADARLVEVLNKVDLLPEEERQEVLGRGRKTCAISAVTGQGLPELLALIDRSLAGQREIMTLQLLPSDGEAIAWLHANGDVLEQVVEDNLIRLRVALSPADAGRFRHRYGGKEG